MAGTFLAHGGRIGMPVRQRFAGIANGDGRAALTEHTCQGKAVATVIAGAAQNQYPASIKLFLQNLQHGLGCPLHQNAGGGAALYFCFVVAAHFGCGQNFLHTDTPFSILVAHCSIKGEKMQGFVYVCVKNGVFFIAFVNNLKTSKKLLTSGGYIVIIYTLLF